MKSRPVVPKTPKDDSVSKPSSLAKPMKKKASKPKLQAADAATVKPVDKSKKKKKVLKPTEATNNATYKPGTNKQTKASPKQLKEKKSVQVDGKSQPNKKKVSAKRQEKDEYYRKLHQAAKYKKYPIYDSEVEEEEEVDPYPGPAPIPADKLLKYDKGEAEGLKKDVRGAVNRARSRQQEALVKYSTELSARSELLLPEESGFLEADKDEFTSQFRQSEIKSAVDITSATKQFDLALQFGPYKMKYSRNGRKLLIGGYRGHVAAFDWVTKNLTCEMNVMESVHDVAWLHNETMYAVAQKQWTYIYDNQGIELHCIKKLDHVLKMEFLPYHFLLATASDRGSLSWLDVSMGKMVRQTRTHLGRLDVLCQNPRNAVLCLGHAQGTVTMWTPNFQAPVVKMLCHQQPIRSVAIDHSGMYMATSSADTSLKIWDLRTYNCLQAYKLGCGASNVAFSQKGLLAVSLGNIIEVYKDTTKQTVDYPYLKHHVGSSVSGLQFCPFEDVLGVSHGTGMSSLLIPGAGEANFDALELNPFQTKSQRRETEVKSLLEKIQPELITLDPTELGDVNRKSVIEKFEERTKFMFEKPKKIDVKPRKNAKTARQFHIKKRLQEESRRTHVGTVSKKQKVVLARALDKPIRASHETRRRPQGTRAATAEGKTSVLDRFKPIQLKKTKTV